MARTRFSAAENGFHFANRFVNVMARLPDGRTVQTSGRCGGMSFAALDCFFAGVAIPAQRSADFPDGGIPADGTPIADYIMRRQLDSFVSLTALRFVTWTVRPDHGMLGLPGVYAETRQELRDIRARVDAGSPVPLGLISAKAHGIGDLVHNHQVVAYGYDDGADGGTRLYAYDNNHPDTEVVLTVPGGHGVVTASTGEEWRGVFRQAYDRRTPPADLGEPAPAEG